jgi:hypothetical protein
MQFGAEVLSVEFEPCRCSVLAEFAPPNREEPSHLREGDIRPAEVCLDMHHRRMWFDVYLQLSVDKLSSYRCRQLHLGASGPKPGGQASHPDCRQWRGVELIATLGDLNLALWNTRAVTKCASMK